MFSVRLAMLFLAVWAAFSQNRMSREILTLPPPPYDARIRYGSDANHFADLRVPKNAGPHPVVVVIHGGFWRAAYDLAYAGHMADDLMRRGYATWNIEYRRIGQQGGGYPGTLEDVAAAVDYLERVAEKHKLNLKRVVALGHSAGGHLALWLATRKNARVRLSGVVSLAGVGDLRAGFDRKLGSGVVADFMGCGPIDCPERYREASPVERLPVRVPLRLYHGTRDDIVPVQMAEAFEVAARKAGDDVTLTRLQGAGHFELVDPRSAEWKQIQIP